MTTVTTTRTTVTTTRVGSPGGGHAGPNGRSHDRRGRGGGQSGGGQGAKSSRSGGGGGGCGGGCLSGAVQWLALAGAIIILVAWILRCLVAKDGDSKIWGTDTLEDPNLWFEFLFVAFICLMVILGGFGIGGLDSFLEEYLQWTVSPLGKGLLILLFCCRVWVMPFSLQTSTAVISTIASILCIAATVLGVLVLLVGLGVA